MEEYEKTAKPKYKMMINIHETHTMAQVWEIVNEEVQKHNDENKKGIWSGLQTAFRVFSENNTAVESWLGLLPAESQYFSILCGGLKLIIKVSPISDSNYRR